MKEKETGDTMNKKDSTAILDLKQYEDFLKSDAPKTKRETEPILLPPIKTQSEKIKERKTT